MRIGDWLVANALFSFNGWDWISEMGFSGRSSRVLTFVSGAEGTFVTYSFWMIYPSLRILCRGKAIIIEGEYTFLYKRYKCIFFFFECYHIDLIIEIIYSLVNTYLCKILALSRAGWFFKRIIILAVLSPTLRTVLFESFQAIPVNGPRCSSFM